MDFNDDEHISFESNKKNVIKEKINKTSPKKLTKPSRRVIESDDEDFSAEERNLKEKISKTSPKKLTKPSRRVIESDDEDFSAEERNLQTKEQPKKDPTRKKPSPKKNVIAKNKPKMILGIFYF